jgi:cysteine desulfurase
VTADVYLDYAASAPLRPSARQAYLAADVAANPHAWHRLGRRASQVLDEARLRLGKAFGADSAEVIFTSGATESNALAIRGLFAGRQTDKPRPYLLVGATEHDSVLANAVLAPGVQTVRIPVDRQGTTDLGFVADHLQRFGEQTALISLMSANNETGVVQDIATLTDLAQRHTVPVHSDWAAAAGKLPLDFSQLALTAVSISAHKLGGPLGIGALLIRRDAPIRPLVGGGGQERGIRPGTVDARGAAAFAAAADEALKEDHSAHERLFEKLDLLVAQHPHLEGLTPIGLSGPAHLPALRLFVVAGALGESLAYLLDQAGFACSTGSACHAGVNGPSHVLQAMGLGDRAASGIRLSIGWATTAGQIEAFVAALPQAVELARAASAAGGKL